MGWARAAKVLFVFILLGFGLYGAFVAGQTHSLLAPAGTSSASANEAPDIRFMKRRRQNKTADGRFGTDCNTCFVPFIRLIAQPEKYHNKKIWTIGFLKRVYGYSLRLYPTEDSAKSTGLYEYIEIYNTRPKDAPAQLISRDLEPKLKEGTWVWVAGRFDALYDDLALGALHDGSDIEEIKEIPALPLPGQPPNVVLRKIGPVRPGVPQIDVTPDAH